MTEKNNPESRKAKNFCVCPVSSSLSSCVITS